jgi:hypothetical protein
MSEQLAELNKIIIVLVTVLTLMFIYVILDINTPED